MSRDLEAMALEAHERANLPVWFPTARELAHALGIIPLLLTGPLASSAVVTMTVGDVEFLHHSPSADERSLFWGLAATLLGRDGRRYTRAEADHLALALAIPADRAHKAQYFKQHLADEDVAQRLAAVCPFDAWNARAELLGSHATETEARFAVAALGAGGVSTGHELLWTLNLSDDERDALARAVGSPSDRCAACARAAHPAKDPR